MAESRQFDCFKWEIIEAQSANPETTPIAIFQHRADAVDFLALPRYTRKLTMRPCFPSVVEVTEPPAPPKPRVVKPKKKGRPTRPRSKPKVLTNGTAAPPVEASAING